MATVNEVFSSVLALSLADRAELAKRLIESLNAGEPDPGAEAAWAEEIEARIAAYQRGELKATPWKEAIAEIRKSFAKDRAQ
ncbi:MAG TPA: addiction module protein [Pirellulales bacterium]|jgi:putative addiction module component (TIGR02574 family)|nr:addiction module protein [Pirellulales bacterium]